MHFPPLFLNVLRDFIWSLLIVSFHAQEDKHASTLQDKLAPKFLRFCIKGYLEIEVFLETGAYQYYSPATPSPTPPRNLV